MLRRLLIVDPDPTTRDVLELAVADEGFRMIGAETAEQALEALSGHEVDVIVCELSVPGVDGFELVPQLGRAAPQVPVLLLSSGARADLAAQTLRRGAFECLSKPISAAEALLKITRAYERQSLRRARQILQRDMERAHGDQPIVAASNVMIEMLEAMESAASYRAPALIRGARGTGKEVLARAIHAQSSRRHAPFVAVDCMVEGEARTLSSRLFGPGERQSSGGPGGVDRGLLLDAHGGTIYLNEISAMGEPDQRQLLHLMVQEEIQQRGDAKAQRLDVRILAATAIDLEEEVAEGRFVPELYARISQIHVAVPPLAERREDLPLLVDHFLAHARTTMGSRVRAISDAAHERLAPSDWPGTVRGLRSVIGRATMIAEGERLTARDLPGNILSACPGASVRAGTDFSLKRAKQAFEAEMIQRALRATGGNRTHAARLLEISHRALLYKIKDYGIDRA